ncbi:MAG: TolC family protein, partial [Gemmatimonadota bacterium]|nr:TolC family protein [Gemmatimonadota bacterium]
MAAQTFPEIAMLLHLAMSPLMRTSICRVACALGGVLWVTSASARAGAQTPNVQAVSLDSLLHIARANSPVIRAARARSVAARLRVGPAGARPDPMLMAGVQNLPLSSPGFSAEEMTMKMIGVGQTIPAPGKLALRTKVAQAEADAVQAQSLVAERDVQREVSDAYYDVVAATDLLSVTSRGQTVLTRFLPAAEAQYASGSGAQIDLIKARLEATRLAADGAQLAEDRRAALARLAAALVPSTDNR